MTVQSDQAAPSPEGRDIVPQGVSARREDSGGGNAGTADERRCAGIMVLSPTGKVLYANRPIQKFLAALHHSGGSCHSTVQTLPASLTALFEDLMQALNKRPTDLASAERETRVLTVTAEDRSFLIQAFGLPGHRDASQRVLFTMRETGRSSTAARGDKPAA